ncbi:MAG TPA: DUF4928 family protein [Candidatus Angelobacter sp.]|jgi:hypothetical protein|nr:DUF4928 family protein [Candidatus Angelobacter sp.]
MKAKNGEIRRVVLKWLDSYRNKKTGIAARNVVAAGIVVLDKLCQKTLLAEEDAFTSRGELKGARSGLDKVLERHGIPATYLKEATGRQAATYARILLQKLEYGKRLRGDANNQERQERLQEAIEIMRAEAFQWLQRQPLKIDCNRQSSPAVWVNTILKKAQGRSGGKVEQHLVGAKLQERYLTKILVPNFPGHAGDLQTKRSGDFDVGRISYHVTANPTRDHLRKCKDNAASNRIPVLIVPGNKVADARFYARDEGVEDRVTVLSLEDFIAQNVIEISSERDNDLFETMTSIINEYNRRIQEIETDPSLKIDVQ